MLLQKTKSYGKIKSIVIMNSFQNPQQSKANLHKSSQRELAAKLTEDVGNQNQNFNRKLPLSKGVKVVDFGGLPHSNYNGDTGVAST